MEIAQKSCKQVGRLRSPLAAARQSRDPTVWRGEVRSISFGVGRFNHFNGARTHKDNSLMELIALIRPLERRSERKSAQATELFAGLVSTKETSRRFFGVRVTRISRASRTKESN